MRYTTGVILISLTGLMWSTQGLLLRLMETHDT
jgi:hypothetical protein